MHGVCEDICEVFFDDVRIPAGNIIGSRGGGWSVSKSVLKYERLWLADTSVVSGQFAHLVELARRTPMNDETARRTRAKGSSVDSFRIQGTKPQTVGLALNDSPAGLLGWIVEKFRTWSDRGGDVTKFFTTLR